MDTRILFININLIILRDDKNFIDQNQWLCYYKISYFHHVKQKQIVWQ